MAGRGNSSWTTEGAKDTNHRIERSSNARAHRALAATQYGASIGIMGRTNASVTVEVELPRDALGDIEVSQLGIDLRRLWAVEQVRRHRLGVGRAAEVAGMPRAAFMQFLGEHGLPVIDYPLEDLKEELSLLGSR